jgi:hypothetical protein
MRRFGQSAVPAWTSIDALKGLGGLRYEEISHWPLASRGYLTGLSISIHGFRSLRRWAERSYKGLDPQGCHPDWLVHKAVSSFAKSPSLANLHAQLSIIAKIDQAVSTQFWSIPWPVAVCLRAVSSGESWDDVLLSVKNGSLGNESDWADWEAENAQNLPLSKCTPGHGVDVSRNRLGPIVATSGWSHEARPDAIEFVRDFTASLRESPEMRDAETLVNLCCFVIYRLEDEQQIARGGDVVEFVEACSQLELPVTAALVAGIVAFKIPTTEKRTMFERIAGCKIRSGWLSNWNRERSETSAALEEIWQDLASDEWQPVLRCVSVLPPLDAIAKIPQDVLLRIAAAGDDGKRIASKLTLDGLRWHNDESAMFARAALSLEADYSNHLEWLLDFMDSSTRRGPHLESFLIELLKIEAPEINAGLRSRASSLLVKLVDRRPAISELPDPEIKSRPLH